MLEDKERTKGKVIAFLSTSIVSLVVLTVIFVFVIEKPFFLKFFPIIYFLSLIFVFQYTGRAIFQKTITVDNEGIKIEYYYLKNKKIYWEELKHIIIRKYVTPSFFGYQNLMIIKANGLTYSGVYDYEGFITELEKNHFSKTKSINLIKYVQETWKKE